MLTDADLEPILIMAMNLVKPALVGIIVSVVHQCHHAMLGSTLLLVVHYALTVILDNAVTKPKAIASKLL